MAGVSSAVGFSQLILGSDLTGGNIDSDDCRAIKYRGIGKIAGYHKPALFRPNGHTLRYDFLVQTGDCKRRLGQVVKLGVVGVDVVEHNLMGSCGKLRQRIGDQQRIGCFHRRGGFSGCCFLSRRSCFRRLCFLGGYRGCCLRSSRFGRVCFFGRSRSCYIRSPGISGGRKIFAGSFLTSQQAQTQA